MASSMIHIAVANELNKKLKRDSQKLLIGTIAPDISKLIGENKVRSHFLENENTDIPDLYKFLSLYKNSLNDDFVLGYYIHLYTDYLWFKYFIPEIYGKGRMAMIYIYNDYTNLNIQIIDEYQLDLKIFYNEIPDIDNIIKEIPMDKLYLIINKAGEIIENSKINKEFVFNTNKIPLLDEDYYTGLPNPFNPKEERTKLTREHILNKLNINKNKNPSKKK